jgi:hypothetical protein
MHIKIAQNTVWVVPIILDVSQMAPKFVDAKITRKMSRLIRRWFRWNWSTPSNGPGFGNLPS